MTNNVEQQKIECNGESFTRGTYNGISVIIRDRDGFINATEMCEQFNKRFRKINENHAWLSYLEAFKHEYSVNSDEQFSYVINKGIKKEVQFLRGTYVDKRLINYIAIWASPIYAITVGKIMDAINERVHETLTSNELADTVDNAQSIFNNIVESIKTSNQSSFEEQFCYGVRDSVHRLDSNEQDELYCTIKEYQSIKERLCAVEKKVDEWGSFVKQYHPDFEK